MKARKKGVGRRNFFKAGAVAALPLLMPATGYGACRELVDQNPDPEGSGSPLNFVFDGPWFAPRAYMGKLMEIDRRKPIQPDMYGSGGVTRELEEEFARITGKEKAIYLPTGTMANQVAMKLLNGPHTKVIVPENSHIFRDEADAAQSVHALRTVPLGRGRPYFDLPELKEAINYLEINEVFESGLGTVVIENPVRRADGTVIPLEILTEITDYCKAQGYRLHLDGARLHIASAYSKVPVSEYASHFDTVYISLYKYLNAAGGGILCGDAALINQVPHLIKILGGSMLHGWANTAMALYYLNGVEERWEQIRKEGYRLVAQLNQLKDTELTAVENGSNVFVLELDDDIDFADFAGHLYGEHQISLRPPDARGNLRFKVNETLLSHDIDSIVAAWQSALAAARA